MPLLIQSHPSPADLNYLEDQINQHNMAATGIPFGSLLAAFERNKSGEITAGISGYTWGDCCQIEFLWVHQNLRGQGTGTRLLQAAEDEARKRGCVQIILGSYSFQAPGFYQKHGYEVIGIVQNFPAGHQHYYFKKSLK